MITKPYALAEGEGRAYEWHGVLFTIKAAAAETGGLLSIWEVATRPGEEPQPHVHEEDELFYVMSRGIPRDEAERLIVFGFFNEVLDRIDLGEVRTSVDRSIEAELEPES